MKMNLLALLAGADVLVASVLAIKAHMPHQWIESMGIFAIAYLLYYTAQHRNDPKVKRWLDWF
ncbi:hypothetical protein [Sulfuricurvum sp.]|uniref:hypothetical protein n=1 Tax=Sulfuricurvum sp. TaxID=2025608 RepID=UPI002D3C6A1E|nr:hypothetical protein [Sulfuricurvum sp.]HZF69397.1 hypothetical protein [Sulfuricurvum sp.]